MKLLVVGGAGYVGSIVRSSLEREHDCRYLDLKPVPGRRRQTFVGDVNDEKLLAKAVKGQSAIVWLAMGVVPGVQGSNFQTDPAFDVNVQGLYRCVRAAMREGGVRQFVYTSSLSVYNPLTGKLAKVPLDESDPVNAFDPYGMTKYMGEIIGEMAIRSPWTFRKWKKNTDPNRKGRIPPKRKFTYLSLRLMFPRNENDWPGNEYARIKDWHPLGPEDTRQLYLHALRFNKPGSFVVQATGDLEGHWWPNTRATELLGWKPTGR